MEQGLVLSKISRAVKFEQSAWLEKWIDMNTKSRTAAQNGFEKDDFKLLNTAVFGKTVENVKDRAEIKCAFDEE